MFYNLLPWYSTVSPSNQADIGNATSTLDVTLAKDLRLDAAGLAVLAVVLLALTNRRTAVRVVLVCTAIGAVVVALLPVLAFAPAAEAAPFDLAWPEPFLAYRARIASGALLLLLLGVAFFLGFTRRRLPRAAAWVVAPTCVALAVSFMLTCVSFRAWVDDYQQRVRTSQGIVAMEDSGIDQRFVWEWTNPSLSLLLQSDPSQGIVLNPDYSDWEPFDPRTELPTLPEGFH